MSSKGPTRPLAQPSAFPAPEFEWLLPGCFPHTVAGPRRLFTGLPCYAQRAPAAGEAATKLHRSLNGTSVYLGLSRCQPRCPRRSAAHFLRNASVLEPYVEHGEQAQRSNSGPIACFDRQALRNAGIGACAQAFPGRRQLCRGTACCARRQPEVAAADHRPPVA